LEQYVRRAIEAEEISWIPLNKAMRLEQVASGAEVIRKDLKDSIRATGTSLTAKLDEFQVDVHQMFQQLMSTLKQETNDVRAMMPLNTLMEFDEQNADEMTVMTENSGNEHDEGSFGYHITLSILDIEGLDLDDVEPTAISVRVVCDNDIYSIPVTDSSDEIVFLDANRMLPLFDNVYPSDTRQAQIQVLNAGFASGSHLSVKGAASKFLGEVHLFAVELLNEEEERVILKKFKLPDSEATCTMRIMVKVKRAKGFGRDDEDK